MRIAIILIFFQLSLTALWAQTKVTGTVTDSIGNGLPGASIILLEGKDSVMHSFTTTDVEGKFIFKKVTSGRYVLQASYVGYSTYSSTYEVTKTEAYDLGIIQLSEKGKVLDGVSVTADRIPIVVKEDTIEYNAAAFKTKPNASVEDLLKKLPGVEVEEDGTIKAQGETVNKVLVDGKEFFGDDPKLATRNLSSDAVDKVQVFDKLSEMAEFTGIDDGDRDKTINLSLKEGKKKGVFGKVTGGYGSDDRYKAKANINRFNKTTQLSFLGSTNNINESDFSIRDYINFNGGLSQLAGGGGRISINGNNLGFGDRLGINTSASAGVNFNHDFKDNSELSINYFFNALEQRLERQAVRDNFINEQTFSSLDSSTNLVNNYNHRLNVRLKKVLNSLSDLTFRSNLGLTTNDRNSREFNSTFDPFGNLQSQSSQFNNLEGNSYNLKGAALYRRKSRKKGRAFTASIEANINNGDAAQRVNSSNQFFNESGINEEVIIDQEQDERNDQTDYKTGLTYTEPIGGRKYLQINYTRQNFDNKLDKSFFDLLPDGTRSFNSTLSTNYRRDYFYDKGGINLLFNFKKSTLNVGGQAQYSSLKGTLTEESVTIKRTFFNVLPSLRWKIDFGRSKNLSFDYFTSVNEPTLQQLQPFVDNSNPLRIYIGNPDLKVEYRHSARVNFMLFDSFSFTSLFFSMNATLTNNKITNATEIDEFLRQTIRPVNIGQEFSATGYLSFGTPIKPLGMKVNLDVNNSAIISQLFVNALENDVNRWINTVDIKFENRKKKIWDVSVGGSISVNDTKYSNNTELNQQFINHTLYGNLGLTIKENWDLSTSMDYKNFSGDAFNSSQDFTIWGVEVSRSFLKFNRGQIKLSVFDLLNNNRGVNRNSSFNYIEDERYNALGRYFMASFTYSLR